MIYKTIQILKTFLPALLLCCLSTALWAGENETAPKWSYVIESCSDCDFDVDVDVVDSYCDFSNGSISLDVSGGAAPYTYLWSTGETTSSISDLGDQDYFVTITDANGCSEELEIDVDDDSSNVDANIYPNETTCGLDNGYITSNVSGGVGPYVFTWDDGFVGAERTDLEPGTYCVTVTDALGCTDDLCATVEEGSTAIGAVINTTPTNCGEATGTITVLPYGGNPPYEYDWTPDVDDDANLDNLSAGEYTLVLTDDDNCEISYTVEIEDDCGPQGCTQPVIASILIEEAHCGTADGQVTITMADPTVNYIYNWSPNVSSNNIATNVASGTYSVTITDPSDASCNVSETFTVGTVDGPNADLETTNADCGASNGTATFTPAGYTYEWSDGEEGASRDDLASGNYQVTITDPANPGCQDVVTVMIGENPTLSYDIDINQEPDCGVSNGSVTINVTGGSGNYSYSWGNGNTQTNLSSGIYCVDIVDTDNGCEVTACFSLNDNVEQVSIEIDNIDDIAVSCAGDTNGEVVFTIDNMNAATPLSTSIQDVDGNVYAANELPAGFYCVVVTDANDCAAGSACFEVTEPAHLDVDIAVTDVTCDNAGMIELLFVNGGIAPYTIAWSTGNSNSSISNLNAGDYSFTLTDANGCSLTEILTVDDNAQNCDDCTAPVIGSVVIVEAHCNESDGQVTINMASAGSYSYSWSPNVSASNSATNIPSDTYNVTITDTTDPTCFVTETFTVGTIDGPDADLVTTNADCGASNGTATFTPASYTYEWSDGAPPTANRTDLAAGNYQVTITDPNNPDCQDIVTVLIGENPTLTYEVVINQLPDCNESNGSVTINVNGGSGNYTYSWGTGNTQTNLSSGIYCVDIVDTDNGCDVTACFALNDNVPQATVTIDNPIVETSCPGSGDGTVVFTVEEMNVALPLTITIEDDNGTVYNNGELPAGNYCVLVADANGCAAGSACFEVVSPTHLDVDIAVTDVTCTVAGEVELLFITGGTTPYTIAWSTGGSGNTISSLSPGDYSFTLTDANGCSLSETVTVDDNAIDCGPCETPIIASIVVVETPCNQSLGQATITMAVPGTYTYQWSPNVSSSNIATGIASGTYNVTITDPNHPDCPVTEVFTVGTIDGPEATLVTTNATCGVSNGTATFTPADYTYEWNDGTIASSRTDLASGNYQVTITDPADPDCPDVVTVVIGEDPSLTYDVVINQLPECNEANGSVTINVAGGSGDYTYSWGPTNTQTTLTSGAYCVTITDNTNGCSVVACFSLNDNVPLAEITIDPTDVQVSCPGSTDGTVVFTVDPMNAAQPLDTIIVDADNNEYTNGSLAPGNYCIFITDANGCAAGSECFEVTAPEQLDVDIAPTPVTCDAAGNIDLLFLSGGTPPYTITWSTGTGGTSLPNLTPGDYSFTLTDANGCVLTETVNVANQAIDCGCEEPVITSVVIIETACEEENGSATVNIAQNPANYSFEWSCGTCSSSQSLSGVAAGTYEVTITDLSDPTCSLIETFTIGTTNGPDPTQTTITPATCNDADGTVTFTPANYTYFWNDMVEAASRTNLPTGEYQVTVTDPADTACINVITVLVGQTNLLELAVNVDVLPDCQVANGQATISVVAGGSGDYTYSWGAATGTMLASGVYMVTVTDNISGCEESITFVINDNVPPATVDITNSNIITSCPGAGDATVVYTVTPSPGFNGDPVVTIVDMNGFPVAADNLSPGEYCILVRDAAGCLAGSSCFVVNDPSQIDVDIAVHDVNCDTLGTISLSNIIVGTSPYEIVWPTITPAPADPENLTDLEQGVYNFILMDANGCAVSENVTVGGTSGPANPMLPDVISCDEVTFLNVNSPGNVVSWFNCDGTPAGPNPLEVTVIDTTCYYVEITNAEGCVVKDSVNVIEAPLPMADFTYELSPCADTAFVQFTDASTTGSGDTITSWNWLFSNGVTSNEQNPGVFVFEEGEFIASLTVTNNFGCSDTFIDTIQISILINIAPPIEIEACPGDTVDLFPGAIDSLTYNWSPADSLTDPTSPNPMSTALSNTTYMVTITSADGLCQVVRTVDLVFTPMVTLELASDTILCVGGNIMVSGSTNGTDICWFDSNGLGTGVEIGCGDNVSLPGLDPSDPYYYAIAEDANGCRTMDSMMVIDYSIGISLEPQGDLCAGDSLFLNPLYNLNSATHDFMWTPSGNDTETVMVNPGETASYDVTVSNDFCEATETFEVVVRDVGQEAALTADPDTIFLGQTSQLQALLESGATYEWSNSETLTFSEDPSSPIAAPLETTDYTVTITDEIGCEGDATTRVVVIDECDEPYIFFPNAFSPNNDGHNDVLYLRGFNADEVHFVIYNRWGEKVFESKSQDSGWDGTYKNEALCSDVYGFYLRVLCRNGQEYIKKGNVTLLR